MSLRKDQDGRSLKVGLKIVRYLDQDILFERLLGGRRKYPSSGGIEPLSAVLIYENQICAQRGLERYLLRT